MTIPHLTNDQMISLLRDAGYEVVSDDFFESHDRIILKNLEDGNTFALQYKAVYYYPFVVKMCDMLGVEAPDDCRKCHDQWVKQRDQVDKNENKNPPGKR